jgi:hypothetical protein
MLIPDSRYTNNNEIGAKISKKQNKLVVLPFFVAIKLSINKVKKFFLNWHRKRFESAAQKIVNKLSEIRIF